MKPILKAIFILPDSVAEQSLFIAGSGSDFGKVSVSVPDSNLEPDLDPNTNFTKFCLFTSGGSKVSRKVGLSLQIFFTILIFVFHLMLDLNSNPVPECVGVPVPLRKKLRFWFHNTGSRTTIQLTMMGGGEGEISAVCT